MTTDDPRHGTRPGYAAGCREVCCRKAHAAYRRAERKHNCLTGPLTVSALGTQRRINALQAIGWTQELLAERGGWRNADDVNEIMKRKRVTLRTARRVDDLYRKLESTRGPSNIATLYAARQGWATPACWDDIDNDVAPQGMRIGHQKAATTADEFIVQCVVDGTRVAAMTVADRRAVTVRLRARGHSVVEIALRCGVSPEVVQKDLERAA